MHNWTGWDAPRQCPAKGWILDQTRYRNDNMMDGQIHQEIKKEMFLFRPAFTNSYRNYSICKILLDTAPKEPLGFLIKLNIVADSIQPKGSRERKDV